MPGKTVYTLNYAIPLALFSEKTPFNTKTFLNIPMI